MKLYTSWLGSVKSIVNKTVNRILSPFGSSLDVIGEQSFDIFAGVNLTFSSNIGLFSPTSVLILMDVFYMVGTSYL